MSWLSEIEEDDNKPFYVYRLAYILREYVSLVERYAFHEAKDELSEDALELLENS